jgi:hypothetical protein
LQESHKPGSFITHPSESTTDAEGNITVGSIDYTTMIIDSSLPEHEQERIAANHQRVHNEHQKSKQRVSQLLKNVQASFKKLQEAVGDYVQQTGLEFPGLLHMDIAKQLIAKHNDKTYIQQHRKKILGEWERKERGRSVSPTRENNPFDISDDPNKRPTRARSLTPLPENRKRGRSLTQEVSQTPRNRYTLSPNPKKFQRTLETSAAR